MTLVTSDFPVREPIIDKDRIITERWRVWLRDLRLDVNKDSTRLATVSAAAQSASIVSTPFQTSTLTAGTYRVTAFTHITAVATVTTSLIVTALFTHKGFSCSLPSAALTTNLTTGVQSNTFSFAIDAGTSISYSTTYAPNAAGTGTYSVDLVLEAVNV